MNWALSADVRSVQATWHWSLVLTLPLLIAAGIIEKTTTSSSLPEEQSYRSDLSDIVTESSSWRKGIQDGPSWRDSSPTPATGWRTNPEQQATPGSKRKKIELFPKYRSGDPAAFDHSSREEKGQIKVFEFGH